MKWFRNQKQLIDAWADGRLIGEQPIYRASNMMASATTIYSFGLHFTLAKFIFDKDGRRTVWVSPSRYTMIGSRSGYSRTTARQKSRVMLAIWKHNLIISE